MRFLFMKVRGNWFLGIAFCVPLDVNGEHIVLDHNEILRLQTEAMMDSFLSLLQKETNLEIRNNTELV